MPYTNPREEADAVPLDLKYAVKERMVTPKPRARPTLAREKPRNSKGGAAGVSGVSGDAAQWIGRLTGFRCGMRYSRGRCWLEIVES